LSDKNKIEMNKASRITTDNIKTMGLGGFAGGGGGLSGYNCAPEVDGVMKILNRHIITVITIAASAANAAILTLKGDLRETAK